MLYREPPLDKQFEVNLCTSLAGFAIWRGERLPASAGAKVGTGARSKPARRKGKGASAQQERRVDREQLSKLFDLTGRVAIVTGGTRGIGLAIAEGFTAAGAKVVVASRKPDACAESEAHLLAMGGEALGVPTHMGDLGAITSLVRRTVDRFGRLDIVVNNAANELTQPLGQFTPEAWEKSYAVNLRGPVFLVQDALPYLKASPCAAIVNVISAGAFLFSSAVSMYAGGKAALMSFTRSMAAEFAPFGIRVNGLAPGSVDTSMLRKNTPEVQAMMTAASFQRRSAHADEMVGPALLLASDAGSFITGQVIIADGGLTPH
jgi:NAD(P)-dependent dehydrogenase (short-subunit alcohol dehydrogenase family)